eukprot:m.6568 g.6568  ORF g.6568 m.6568 type:complete len:144 (-) comp5173_c0_seq1:84-515(-)
MQAMFVQSTSKNNTCSTTVYLLCKRYAVTDCISVTSKNIDMVLNLVVFKKAVIIMQGEVVEVVVLARAHFRYLSSHEAPCDQFFVLLARSWTQFGMQALSHCLQLVALLLAAMVWGLVPQHLVDLQALSTMHFEWWRVWNLHL